MTKVYTARVLTDSADTYVWVYKKKPTRKQVIWRLHDMELAAPFEVYDQTTSVYIEQTELID